VREKAGDESAKPTSHSVHISWRRPPAFSPLHCTQLFSNFSRPTPMRERERLLEWERKSMSQRRAGKDIVQQTKAVEETIDEMEEYKKISKDK
jgi:hypothetical protein